MVAGNTKLGASLIGLVAAAVLCSGAGCTTVERKRLLADYDLKEAIQNGNTAYVGRQLAAGLDANTWRYKGYSMLHFAAGRGQDKMVGFLISNGADPNAVTERGDTPLSLAAEKDHVKTAGLLIAAGADCNRGSPLYRAAAHGQMDIAQLLMEHGANVNLPAGNALTPLHAAVARNDLVVATLLLRAGADTHFTAIVKGLPVTPMAVAEANGDPEMIRLLSNSEALKARLPADDLLENVTLMSVDTDGIIERAGRLVTRKHPQLDLSEFEPGYVICLTHPAATANPPVIIVEWLSREPVAIERGAPGQPDRKKVKKLQVRITPDGRLLEINDTFAWLLRAAE